MRDLNFKYASAKNFICFGPEGIELHFQDFGKVVLVTGVNCDNGTEDDPASNGTGKSSIQDIISYAIYGKTVKNPKQLHQGDVINVKTGKGLEVEVEFDDYKIKRCCSPSKLQLWHSKDHLWDKSTEITLGTSQETQKKIEDIIGLTHQAFCNVLVFDDSDAHSFLQVKTEAKRQIAENLLGLDKYRAYHDVVKKDRSEHKRKGEDLNREIAIFEQSLEAAQQNIATVKQRELLWLENLKKQILNFEEDIKTKQQELEQADSSGSLVKYHESQEKLNLNQDKIIELEHKKEKLSSIIDEARTKLITVQDEQSKINANIQILNSRIKEYDSKKAKADQLIQSLKNLEHGQECPTCYGTINLANSSRVIDFQNQEIEKQNSERVKNANLLKTATENFGEKSKSISKLTENIAEADKIFKSLNFKIDELKKENLKLVEVKKPDTDSSQKILEIEISQLKKQLSEKKAELKNSPYKEILEKSIENLNNATDQINKKKEELSEVETLMPYYDYYYEAFGDNGIRKFVIDGIIPALNSRIEYWMQHLIDNKIELKFDNQLEPSILRNGTPVYYYGLSNGEKRRINLAVSQAFSYVMMFHSGNSPSLVFLDEITGGGIDRAGVTGVYNMIFELAKEKQVFITTHNDTLLEMLQGCETIKLKKENDITILI
jgi:DNA repair exonuclease SbcCD ATPase subunit